jgi:hypothetical protein
MQKTVELNRILNFKHDSIAECFNIMNEFSKSLNFNLQKFHSKSLIFPKNFL